MLQRATSRFVLTALLAVLASCAADERTGSGDEPPARGEQVRTGASKTAGDGDRSAGSATSDQPAPPPLCSCEELLAPESLQSILGLSETLTAVGYYNTCRYGITGEPTSRSIVNISYNDRYPVQRYEGQLKMAQRRAAQKSGIDSEVIETDDVGSRSYENLTFSADRPVFMQKCFLTRDERYLVSVHLKMKQLDPKMNLSYTPQEPHLAKVSRIVEENLENKLAASKQ